MGTGKLKSFIVSCCYLVLSDQMDEFVDSSINSNYKVLPDLLESLNREKEKLRKQVSKLLKGNYMPVHVCTYVCRDAV